MSAASGSSAFTGRIGDGPPPSTRGSRWRAYAPLVWPLVALGLLLAYNYFYTEQFFHVTVKDGRLFGSVIDILNRGAPTLLLSLGMTLVIATGGIDLSVGAVMAMAGAVAVCLIARPEGSPLSRFDIHGHVSIAVMAAIAIALLAGLWNGVLVAVLRLQPIIATLILMGAGRGIAKLLTAGQQPTLDGTGFGYASIASGSLFMLPSAFIIAATAFLVMGLLVRGSALGLFIEAVGNNRVASRIAGVNAVGVRIACYVVSGLLAGVAGLIATADIKSADPNNIGLNLELDAILATAIGGTSLMGGRFSLLGSVIGALVIQTLTTTILASNVSPDATLVYKALIIVGLCLLQSPQFRGLFRLRRRAA